jgi:hypothetical protein
MVIAAARPFLSIGVCGVKTLRDFRLGIAIACGIAPPCTDGVELETDDVTHR